MAGDSTGTPTAMTMLLFRIDADAALDHVTAESISGAILQINRRARDAHNSGGDPFAVMSEFVPPDILRTLYPVVGAPREDGEIDHVLRIPVSR